MAGDERRLRLDRPVAACGVQVGPTPAVAHFHVVLLGYEGDNIWKKRDAISLA
jgi:hypothetical protein